MGRNGRFEEEDKDTPPLRRLPPQWKERLHAHMAGMDGLWHLALFGIAAGVLAGAVIVLFRLLVESVQATFLPGGDAENYEALAWWWRLALPLAGGLLIGLVFQAAAKEARAVGVVHVMERLRYHQADLPRVNAVMQFFGAAASIVFGHSVGREGPAVHLGATAGSRLGHWFHLANSSRRTLVACGVAAAIAASFNTPLAGVIFAMEVVLMEYAVASFIPIILAAVAATVVSRYFFGDAPAFIVPPMPLGSLQELPWVLLTGVVMGAMAALFCLNLRYFSGLASDRPLWQRTTLGGLLVGLVALAAPQVMGIGYDTVDGALAGGIGIGVLALVAVAKLVATGAGLGLGLPGGLIGPTLVVGACAGAAVGGMAAQISEGPVSSAGLYAMIGMGAMMGATLQAPLAALTALLELTANPHIILPGMLAIVTASLVSSQLLRQPPVFLMLARLRGLDYRDSPVAQALRRVSVLKAMDRDVVRAPRILTVAEADALLRRQPHWILYGCDGGEVEALPSADLARQIVADGEARIDLAEIPAERRQAAPIDIRASLQEARERLADAAVELLYVVDGEDPACRTLHGVVTPEDIEEHYHYPGHFVADHRPGRGEPE